MKSPPIFLFFLLFFYHCNIIKVSKSPQNKKNNSRKDDQLYRDMIPSGKTIDLRNGTTQEILFYGKENLPTGSLFIEKFLEKKDEFSDINLIWAGFGKNKKHKIINSNQPPPLIIIDTEVYDDLNLMKDLDSETIQSINIIQGEAAIKKYGELGINGIIEITTIKN